MLLKCVGALLCFTLAGCSRDAASRKSVATSAPRPKETTTPLSSGRDPFVYANVKERVAPVPEHFRAKLPVLPPKSDWPASAPPQAHFVDGLCFGDESSRESYLESLEKASRNAQSLQALEDYRRLIENCTGESRCDWAARAVASKRPLLVRQTVWAALKGCGERHDKFFDDPDAPASVVHEHIIDRNLGRRRGTGRPWPRMVAAVKDAERSKDLPRLLQALQFSRDTASRDFILKRFGELPAGPAKSAYGRAACAWRAQAEAQRACDVGCKDQPKDSSCTRHDDQTAWPQDLARNACDDTGVSFSSLAEDFPAKKKAIVDALAECLASDRARAQLESDKGKSFLAARLDELAGLDFTKAHQAAKKLKAAVDAAIPASTKSPARWVRDRVAFYERFATAEAVTAKLRAFGFDIRGAVSASLGVDGILEDKGIIVRFDPETDQWPNEHDHLARLVTQPIAKEMKGVVFEEIASEDDTPYVLRAYFDGVVFETEAAKNDDWYDVAAVIGLVNAVLRKRGSESRVALVSAWGNDATTVAAPGKAIVAAHDESLLDLKDAAGTSRSVQDARDRERQIIRERGATPLE